MRYIVSAILVLICAPAQAALITYRTSGVMVDRLNSYEDYGQISVDWTVDTEELQTVSMQVVSDAFTGTLSVWTGLDLDYAPSALMAELNAYASDGNARVRLFMEFNTAETDMSNWIEHLDKTYSFHHLLFIGGVPRYEFTTRFVRAAPPTPVPEPSTLALFGLGLAAFGLKRQKT